MNLTKIVTAFHLSLIVAGTAAAQIPDSNVFSYQGELKENGQVANGSYNMEFGLWDAEVAGSQIGSTVILNGVPVSDGRFTVQLEFGVDAFNQDRWIEITVDGNLLAPRQAITSAPIALQLRGIHVGSNGFLGVNHDSPNARLHVEQDDDRAFYAQSFGNTAIFATTAASGHSAVWATCTAGSGYGVRSEINVSPGTGRAVWGRSFADQGTGVYGEATNSIGTGNGVHGVAFSDAGYAVYGENREGGFAAYFDGEGYVRDRLFVGRETFITSADYLSVNAPVGTDNYGGMYINTDGGGGWPFYGYATSGTSRMWTYYDGGTGDWHVYNSGQRLTVESSGQVGIGDTNPSFTLEVNGSAGKPGGGSWSNSSDRRLKKDIRDLEGALDALLALRGVTFEYKNPKVINELPGERIGMIAQEVEQIFPDWVEERDDGYKSVTFRGFEALTVEALRELRTEKDAEIAALRERITRLESMIHQLAAQPAGGRK